MPRAPAPPREDPSPPTRPGTTLMRGLLEAFVLESLEESPKHGYALLKEMGDRFGEEPNRNKLYPLLARLENVGLIHALPDPDGGERGRIPYALTDSGREALQEYRRLPHAFQHAVHRLWAPDAPRSAPARNAPQTSANPDLDALPYPCEDARVTVEKDARTRALSLRLTGCPMGAYDYCVSCPVHHAVEGLRRLTFG